MSFLCGKPSQDFPNSSGVKTEVLLVFASIAHILKNRSPALQCATKPTGPGRPGFTSSDRFLSSLLQPQPSMFFLDLHWEHSCPATGPSHWPSPLFSRRISPLASSFTPFKPWVRVTYFWLLYLKERPQSLPSTVPFPDFFLQAFVHI